MTKILLDTNAYSSFMAGDPLVFDYMVESDVIFLSTVTLGELFAGFRGGRRYSVNTKELKNFLTKDGVRIINVTIETSEIFGEIKALLSKQGKMIPINDIWIAAQTMEHGAELITTDNHFEKIAGLVYTMYDM